MPGERRRHAVAIAGLIAALSLWLPGARADEAGAKEAGPAPGTNRIGELGERYGRGIRDGAPPSVFGSGGATTNLDSLPTYPEPTDTSATAEGRAGEFTIAPIPSLNPTFGWGIGVVSFYVYQPLETDPKVQPWTTGAVGAYTDNGSWGALGFHRMNLERDTWRLLGGAGYGSFNYDFFGVGNAAGDAGQSIPLNQRSWGGLGEVLRRVWPHLYMGLRYTLLKSRISADAEIPSLAPGFPPLSDIELDATLSALGLRVQYDSRTDQFYPTDGSLFDLKANYYSEYIGSDFDFGSVSLSYNRYIALAEGHVLALRGVAEYGSDDMPFFAMSSFGSHNDLRGYQSGRYRDRALLAAQGEYRLELTDRFGMVAFGGVGEVAENFGDFSFDKLLPSFGGGIRFRIAKRDPINFRVDIARGKDETAFYVGVGEAF